MTAVSSGVLWSTKIETASFHIKYIAHVVKGLNMGGGICVHTTTPWMDVRPKYNSGGVSGVSACLSAAGGHFSSVSCFKVAEGGVASLSCQYSVKRFGLSRVCWGRGCGTFWCNNILVQTDENGVISKVRLCHQTLTRTNCRSGPRSSCLV